MQNLVIFSKLPSGRGIIVHFSPDYCVYSRIPVSALSKDSAVLFGFFQELIRSTRNLFLSRRVGSLHLSFSDPNPISNPTPDGRLAIPRGRARLQARRLMKRHIDDGKQFRHSPGVQRTDDGSTSTSYGCCSKSRAAREGYGARPPQWNFRESGA